MEINDGMKISSPDSVVLTLVRRTRDHFIGARDLHLSCRKTEIARDLKIEGVCATCLKCDGFNARELVCAGFGPKSLRRAGFDLRELKDAGFDAKELKSAGFDPKSFHRAGFDLRQLRDAGFDAQELGFDATDLLQEVSPFESWFMLVFALSRIAPELISAGSSLRQLHARFDARCLRSLGCNIMEITHAGFKSWQATGFHDELSCACFILRKLRDAGFNIEELKFAGRYLRQLQKTTWKLQNLDSKAIDSKAKFGCITRRQPRKPRFRAKELDENRSKTDFVARIAEHCERIVPRKVRRGIAQRKR